MIEDLLTALSQDLTPTCAVVIKEARSVRDEVSVGEASDAVPDLHDRLLVNRAQIERLEYLTAQMLLARARTQQAVTDAKAEVDDAVMQTATKPSFKIGEYASAKEKEAHYALGSVEQTMRLRKAERLHRDVDSTWDYCRVLLRGAEQVQRDLESRIRIITITDRLGG